MLQSDMFCKFTLFRLFGFTLAFIIIIFGVSLKTDLFELSDEESEDIPPKNVIRMAINTLGIAKEHISHLAQDVLHYFKEGKRSVKSILSMHLAVVACGEDDRVEETLVNLKSIVLFSKQHINFHIFAEDHLQEKFKHSLDQWPSSIQLKFNYKLYPINYPDDGHAAQWKKLFKLCASQRLFLPHLLSNIDSILYVDTDILFLSPVDEIWNFFTKFNSTQVAAMSPEHEITNVAWYSRFARHPYYGTTGINSGVMLMNMTRVRTKRYKNDLTEETLTWQEMLLPLYQKYRLNITWGDQDLLNIIFHHNPEMLLTFPCKWNYRPDHCMYMQMCKSAETGVQIMHGCRRAFHIDKWPVFKAVYQAIKDFDFNLDVSFLLKDVQKNLNAVPETNCKKSMHIITDGLRKTSSPREEL